MQAALLLRRLETEKEQRIRHLEQVAARRLGRTSLCRGWQTWREAWLDERRRARLQKAAAPASAIVVDHEQQQEWERETERAGQQERVTDDDEHKELTATTPATDAGTTPCTDPHASRQLPRRGLSLTPEGLAMGAYDAVGEGEAYPVSHLLRAAGATPTPRDAQAASPEGPPLRPRLHFAALPALVCGALCLVAACLLRLELAAIWSLEGAPVHFISAKGLDLAAPSPRSVGAGTKLGQARLEVELMLLASM